MKMVGKLGIRARAPPLPFLAPGFLNHSAPRQMGTFVKSGLTILISGSCATVGSKSKIPEIR